MIYGVLKVDAGVQHITFFCLCAFLNKCFFGSLDLWLTDVANELPFFSKQKNSDRIDLVTII